MQDLVESTWRWRDAGTPMRRRRRIVSGEIMEFLDFNPISPKPRKTLKGVALSTAGPNGRGYKKIKSRPYRALHGFRRAVEQLVANPSAVNESAPGLHSFGRTIAAPALNIRSRCNIFGMVRLCGMNLPGVFVVGCCIVGADAAGSISG